MGRSTVMTTATLLIVCCITGVIIQCEAQPLIGFNNAAVHTGYSGGSSGGGGGGGVYRGGQCCCDSTYEYGCVDWYNRRFPTIIAANLQIGKHSDHPTLHCTALHCTSRIACLLL